MRTRRDWVSPFVVAGAIGIGHPAKAQTLTVDGAQPHQTMDGWINQMRVWDDPHVTETSTRSA